MIRTEWPLSRLTFTLLSKALVNGHFCLSRDQTGQHFSMEIKWHKERRGNQEHNWRCPALCCVSSASSNWAIERAARWARRVKKWLWWIGGESWFFSGFRLDHRWLTYSLEEWCFSTLGLRDSKKISDQPWSCWMLSECKNYFMTETVYCPNLGFKETQKGTNFM